MKTLVLSTYPATAEASGGVVRLRRIMEALAKADVQTQLLAIVPPGPARSSSGNQWIVPLPADAFRPVDHRAIGFHDVLTGLAAQDCTTTLDALEARIRAFAPDALFLEQPYLVDIAAKAMERHPNLKLIYSSANIEAPLKRELAALTPQYYRHPDDLISHVDRMERKATDLASLVIAISGQDAETLQIWGAPKLVVCGNGSHVADTQRGPVRAPDQMNQRWFGCVGSGYWPNVEGVASVLRPSLAFLPVDCRLVLGGRIGEHVQRHNAYKRGRAINDARIIDCGLVSDTAYVDLLRSVDALLLPAFVGGGSMLKAADVLAAGAVTLISRRAMIGYEDIVASAGRRVIVADTPDEFRTRWIELTRLSKDELKQLGAADGHVEASLSWSARLAGLAPALRSALT